MDFRVGQAWKAGIGVSSRIGCVRVDQFLIHDPILGLRSLIIHEPFCPEPLVEPALHRVLVWQGLHHLGKPAEFPVGVIEQAAGIAERGSRNVAVAVIAFQGRNGLHYEREQGVGAPRGGAVGICIRTAYSVFHLFQEVGGRAFRPEGIYLGCCAVLAGMFVKCEIRKAVAIHVGHGEALITPTRIGAPICLPEVGKTGPGVQVLKFDHLSSEKLLLVAPLRNAPAISGQKESYGFLNPLLLNGHFRCLNQAPKQ